MKYLILLMFLSFLSTGCDKKPSTKDYVEGNPANMTCIRVERWMQRCENTEVVCYKYNGEGIQCKWKTQDINDKIKRIHDLKKEMGM